MKLPLLIFAFSLIGTCAASAITVENTAGSLSEKISDKTITTLTVTGTLNAADFDFISSSLPELTTLDMAAAQIEPYAGATVLTSVSTSEANSLPHNALMGMSKLATVKLPTSLTAIGDAALASTAITTIAIPSTVTAIGEGAFSGCDALTAIIVPAAVTDMGTHTFMGCTSLTKATVDADIDSIGASTFARCAALTDVSVNTTVRTIGKRAFAGCTSLANLDFPRALTLIAPEAFEASGLETVDLSRSASLDSIGSWSFARCPNLTSVTLPAELQRIGEGAFFDDTRLEDYTGPEAIPSIAPYTFKGDDAINTAVLLPEGVESVGKYAFTGLNHISSFALPSSLAYIGDNAFEGWTSLSTLDAMGLDDVPELGENVWLGVNQPGTTLNVKGETADMFKAAPQWKEFNIMFVSATTPNTIEDKTNVDARFSGYDLIIKSNVNILSASLYDSTGIRHAYVEPDDTELTIDTSDLASRIFIVKLDLEDGSQPSVKVARRNP